MPGCNAYKASFPAVRRKEWRQGLISPRLGPELLLKTCVMLLMGHAERINAF